jgi:hypothetical protein
VLLENRNMNHQNQNPLVANQSHLYPLTYS